MLKFGIAIGLVSLALSGSAFARGGRCAGGTCGMSGSAPAASAAAAKSGSENVVKDEQDGSKGVESASTQVARQTILRRRFR